MGFSITYKTLFEVRLCHHYFLDKGAAGQDYRLFDLATPEHQANAMLTYDSRNFLRIQPTEACAALLRQYKCVYRQLADKLTVAISAVWDEDALMFRPEVPLDNSLSLCFGIQIVDPAFKHYTNIPLDQGKDLFYFFENKAMSGNRRYPSLSRQAPERSDGTWYNEGEILVNNAALPMQTLIAHAITGTVTPQQEFTVDPEVAGNALSYVNRNDLLSFSGDIWSWDTGLADRSANIQATVRHPSGQQIYPQVNAFEAGTTQVQVRLAEWEEGLYQVALTDASSGYQSEHTFFLQKALKPYHGVMQLHLQSDEEAFSLLMPSGHLLPVTETRRFELRYKNRATTWRYLGAQFANAPESGPHLLTRMGFVALSVVNAAGMTVTQMPNPDQPVVKTERPILIDDCYNLISEIYINS